MHVHGFRAPVPRIPETRFFIVTIEKENEYEIFSKLRRDPVRAPVPAAVGLSVGEKRGYKSSWTSHLGLPSFPVPTDKVAFCVRACPGRPASQRGWRVGEGAQSVRPHCRDTTRVYVAAPARGGFISKRVLGVARSTGESSNKNLKIAQSFFSRARLASHRAARCVSRGPRRRPRRRVPRVGPRRAS